ncbi:MAG: amidohydrolase [Thermoanaerobaculia bacterium]
MSRPLVFSGATIITGRPGEVIKNGIVVIDDGKVVEVGPTGKVFPPRGANWIDATGLTILPGLMDGHAHIGGLGDALHTVRLTGATSLGEVVARIRNRAVTRPDGEWILGRGWDQNDWDVKEFPTAAAVDAAVPQHPVWVRRIDGHAGLANSAAMRAAGITAATPDPSGGRILRDGRGEPTGVFIDNAMNLVEKVLPKASRQQRKERLRDAARNIAANGLTAVHDAGIDAEGIEILDELARERRLPIRAYLMLDDDAALIDSWLTKGPRTTGPVVVRAIKLYADGALGSRGAALLEPYSDDPHHSGLLVSDPAHLADVATRARTSGFQVNTHAIGDRGNRIVIDAYEKAGVTAADRFRVEHLQVIALDDIPRLARLGIIASMQPTHATSDMPWAEARVGAQRIGGAYAWRKVLDAGARLSFGSDFPVEEVNPFLGIHSAVTRQDGEGHPPGGWHPEERLTVGEALSAFTLGVAYSAFEETTRGSIEPGKAADLTITRENPLAISPDGLDDIKVRYTVVDGRIVFDSEAKPQAP